MQGDRGALLAAARTAAAIARNGIHGALGGVLIVDCVSRSLILGKDIREELSAIQTGIGADVPLLGCLTFGEVGAIGTGTMAQYHNKTTVVLALPGQP